MAPPVVAPRVPRLAYWVGVLLLMPAGVLVLGVASIAAGEVGAFIALLALALGLIALGTLSVVRDSAVKAMTPGSRLGWIVGGLVAAWVLGAASCVVAFFVALIEACSGGC